MSRPPLLVGNAQAFWGDDPDAPARLVRQQPDLDFLTLDYLAEVSTKKIAPLVTAGPQGVTGYSSGRPKLQAVFG